MLRINHQRLQNLKTPVTSYEAHDVPGKTSEGRPLDMEEAVKKLDSYVRFPRKIELCVGALVMLAKVSSS